MRSVAIVVFLLAVLCGSVLANNDNNHDVALELPLEQSIANGPWTSRGLVKFVLKRQEKTLSVKLDNPTFEITSPADIAKLNLPSTWVRLRLPAVGADGQIIPSQHLVTSQRGCGLLRDSREVLALITDKTGAVLALQHERSGGSGTACLANNEPLPVVVKLATKITAVMPKESAAPPGLVTNADLVRSAVQQQAGGGGAGAAAAGADPASKAPESISEAFSQSILVKYWYVFGPLFIAYTFFTMPAAPEPGAEGGGDKKKD